MTTATTSKIKEVRSIDLASDSLVAGLTSVLNEKAQGEWFELAVRMLETQAISVRGLKATIAKAQDSTWLKESHVPYFMNAFVLRSKTGGDKVALKKVITTIQDAKRVLKDTFKDELEYAGTYKQFADSVKVLVDQATDAKTRGAGKKVATEKDIKAVAVDADAVIVLALGLLIELGDDSRIIHNFDNAEKLSKMLKGMVAQSHAIARLHPVAS